MIVNVPRSTAIPKGTDGEISKIVQCSAEMADAHLQRNPILVLNDAACVVGAVKTWLRKHHATLTLDDLLKLHEAHEAARVPAGRSAAPLDPTIPAFAHDNGPFAPGTK